MKKNTRKYIEKKKKEGLYGIDWNKINKLHLGGFRQLFRELPKDRTFTAKELADFFERYAPLDPKGLLAKAFKKGFIELLNKYDKI